MEFKYCRIQDFMTFTVTRGFLASIHEWSYTVLNLVFISKQLYDYLEMEDSIVNPLS